MSFALQRAASVAAAQQQGNLIVSRRALNGFNYTGAIFCEKGFLYVGWLQFFKAPYKKEDHTTLIL